MTRYGMDMTEYYFNTADLTHDIVMQMHNATYIKSRRSWKWQAMGYQSEGSITVETRICNNMHIQISQILYYSL